MELTHAHRCVVLNIVLNQVPDLLCLLHKENSAAGICMRARHFFASPRRDELVLLARDHLQNTASAVASRLNSPKVQHCASAESCLRQKLHLLCPGCPGLR